MSSHAEEPRSADLVTRLPTIGGAARRLEPWGHAVLTLRDARTHV